MAVQMLHPEWEIYMRSIRRLYRTRVAARACRGTAFSNALHLFAIRMTAIRHCAYPGKGKLQPATGNRQT